MAKKAYKLTRIPVRKTVSGMVITSRSTLDVGNFYDLSRIDDYFLDLFSKEAENIKNLGLNPDSLTLTIHQILDNGMC